MSNYTFTSTAGSIGTTTDDEITNIRNDIQAEPFLQFNGLVNGSWATFLVIAVASSRLGTIFPKIGLPLITGYMIIGCLCGPYVLNLVTSTEIPDLGYITQIALSFIAFSAGSELYLPELRSLFKVILLITSFNALYTYVICTLFIYLLATAGLVEWLTPYLGSCAFGICLIAGSIMVARSPASAIAVVRELRAKGPITSTMLGVTVVGDVVVLILFTISSSIALAFCSGAGFEGGAFVLTLLSLVAAIGLGYLLGGLLIFLLWIPHVPARFTIIPIGFLVFAFCDWFAVYSLNSFGVSINFDALLICITAGYVVTNRSHNRRAFLTLLGSSASYIFIPFFTKVGVELNLTILYKSLPFAACVFTMRALCVLMGSATGGHLAGLKNKDKAFMWMTMLAQAGVSLGLASEVAVKFPEWGRNFQTTIIAVVLINQFVGPVACKFALKNIFFEAGKMKEGEDAHGGSEHDSHEVSDAESIKLNRCLIVGVDTTSLAVAQRLLDRGYAVTLIDTKKKNLKSTAALTVISPIIHPPKKTAGQAHIREGKKRKKVYTELNVEESVEDQNVEREAEEDKDLELEEFEEEELALEEVDEEEEEEEDDVEYTVRKTKKGFEYRMQPLLLPSDPSHTLSDHLITLIAQLTQSTQTRLTAALIYLPTDIDTATSAVTLQETLHLRHVIARLHHPAWANQCATAGVVPVFDTGVLAHVIMRALIEGNEGMEVIEMIDGAGEKKNISSHASIFESFLIPDNDIALTLAGLNEEKKQSFQSLHSAPTQQLSSLTLSSLASTLAATITAPVKLTTVSASQREEYVSGMEGLHDYQNEGDIKAEMREATAQFLSPSAMSVLEEDEKQKESIGNANSLARKII